MKGPPQILRVANPSFGGHVGVARRDITPPAGIYARSWGSAKHDVAGGVHRPLTATVLTIQSEKSQDPLVLAALDLGWFVSPADEWLVRGPVIQRCALDPARLVINLSHTHAGPCVSPSVTGKPGCDRVGPYVEGVSAALIECVSEALGSAGPATLTWATGRCALATERQMPDPESGRIIVGYHPEARADDTVVVGRVTDESGRVTATLVNYACHPTTLGGPNTMISPDYIGAMREVVENATSGAPCIYLHGAAGELAPRRQYVGDVSVADNNGRQLGHSAVSALYQMLPPGKALAFTGVERSGTDLGRWDPVDQVAPDTLTARQIDVPLRGKHLPPIDELRRRQAECDDRVTKERLDRAIWLRSFMGDGGMSPLAVWLWRVGDAVFIASPAEAHSPLQTELRKRFPDRAVIVMNVCNGYRCYLPRREDYKQDCYQSRIALYEEGCLEETIEACAKAIAGVEHDNADARRQ